MWSCSNRWLSSLCSFLLLSFGGSLARQHLRCLCTSGPLPQVPVCRTCGTPFPRSAGETLLPTSVLSFESKKRTSLFRFFLPYVPSSCFVRNWLPSPFGGAWQTAPTTETPWVPVARMFMVISGKCRRSAVLLDRKGYLPGQSLPLQELEGRSQMGRDECVLPGSGAGVSCPFVPRRVNVP